uniref:Uncharacterized protein n=1 Tax=Anguilla anguilla TaxID=7936 RepID=A0A0E9PRW4_ANGAN
MSRNNHRTVPSCRISELQAGRNHCSLALKHERFLTLKFHNCENYNFLIFAKCGNPAQ